MLSTSLCCRAWTTLDSPESIGVRSEHQRRGQVTRQRAPSCFVQRPPGCGQVANRQRRSMQSSCVVVATGLCDDSTLRLVSRTLSRRNARPHGQYFGSLSSRSLTDLWLSVSVVPCCHGNKAGTCALVVNDWMCMAPTIWSRARRS